VDLIINAGVNPTECLIMKRMIKYHIKGVFNKIFLVC
jgi:hypothetical protein